MEAETGRRGADSRRRGGERVTMRQPARLGKPGRPLCGVAVCPPRAAGCVALNNQVWASLLSRSEVAIEADEHAPGGAGRVEGRWT